MDPKRVLYGVVALCVMFPGTLLETKYFLDRGYLKSKRQLQPTKSEKPYNN
jgi:hypothetical protein